MGKSVLEKRFVQTEFGRVAYLEVGADPKPPVLFVHGIPTSSFLWRHVLRFLQNDFHGYAPDLLGLGDTEPAPGMQRYDMDQQAEALIAFMEAMGHHRFGLVCHDQGGAAAQIIAANQPDRVRALVITDAVAYDNWPVPAIARLQVLAKIPLLSDWIVRSGLMQWIETSTSLSSFKKGVYRRAALDEASIREYLRPLREGSAQRERFQKFLLAGSPRYTMQAVAGLERFSNPTLILWAADDHYISPSWGKKLQEDIPGARRFEIVPFCGHFWQEERPAEFSALIGEFLAAHLRAAKGRSAGDDSAPAGAAGEAKKVIDIVTSS